MQPGNEKAPQEEKSTKELKFLSENDISTKTFPEIARMRQKHATTATSEGIEEYSKYLYSTISECVSIDKSVKYNLYAIVTNVKRVPAPTRSSKLMSQVYITDPSCEGSYGFIDFQFR